MTIAASMKPGPLIMVRGGRLVRTTRKSSAMFSMSYTCNLDKFGCRIGVAPVLENCCRSNDLGISWCHARGASQQTLDLEHTAKYDNVSSSSK